MSATFLATAAARALDGALPALSATYARLAAQMAPTERRLLVNGGMDSDLAGDARALARELLEDLQHDGDRHDWASRRCRGVHVAPAALSARACASLREAVDRSTFEDVDTVDGQLEYQLTLSAAELAEAIGDAAAASLYALAAEAHARLVAPDVREAAAAAPEWDALGFEPPPLAPGAPFYILVRRYSAATRPWFPFHYDGATLSMNVALNDDGAYEGGQLLAIMEGQVRAFSRAEGTAIVHSSALLHAVTRLRAGVRYALVLFFGATCPRAEHRLVRCEPALLRRLYGDQYGGGYHCDRCGVHCDDDAHAARGGGRPMWHCAHWCEYDVCATCHAHGLADGVEYVPVRQAGVS